MSCNEVFREHGLKLTPQRRLILDIIHGSDAHLTGEEILAGVRGRMPGVNKSTVYRTLELLHRMGCIYKSELRDRSIYHHVEEGHHHHLVCERCGKTVDCGEDMFHAVEGKLARAYGFRASFNHMVVSGLCRECSAGTK